MDPKYREVIKRAKNLLDEDPELAKYFVEVGRLTGDPIGKEIMKKILEEPDYLKDIVPEAFEYLANGWVPVKHGDIIIFKKNNYLWSFDIPYSKETLAALLKYCEKVKQNKV